jgi:DNA end-binding protein Ku
MAQQLVSAMTAEFDPASYKDEYREALETIIEAKVEGKETVEIEEPEESGKIVDLMAALEASVNAAKAARDGEKPVSVSEAKEAKEAKARTVDTASKRRTGKADEEEAEAPSKPARRRKTA